MEQKHRREKRAGPRIRKRKQKRREKTDLKGMARTTEVSLVFLYIIINTICCRQRQKQGLEKSKNKTTVIRETITEVED
jgi:transducin (beta)-like 1